MRKYYKLINGVWEEIQKVLAGQVETETIDDTLDNVHSRYQYAVI